MKTNRKAVGETSTLTHEGGRAVKQSAEKELTRAVSSLMLFEQTFYEKGSDIAKRIESLCEKVSMRFLGDLAIKVRRDLKLRHAALFLCVQMLKKDSIGMNHDAERRIIADTVFEVIQRADELAEIVAIYWKNGKQPIPRQLKAGIGRAFQKFDEYSLAKYNQLDKAVKLRDVLFLVHAKPKTKAQGKLWTKLVDNKLKTPDTWEVELSAGKDKKDTFTRLIKAEKLGYMALLRNLRNMTEAGVDSKIVNKALLDGAERSKALPFRFIAAYRHAPAYARVLSDSMLAAMKEHRRLSGKTAVVVDISGSMDSPLGGKSDMNRIDAACALAVYAAEIGSARVFSFSAGCVEVPAHRGLPLIDAISNSQPHGSTYLAAAVKHVLKTDKYDRVVVITDEQSSDGNATLPAGTKGYLINVASYEPALPTNDGNWTRLTGLSERVIEWMIQDEENTD